jgi:hypothetical protein
MSGYPGWANAGWSWGSARPEFGIRAHYLIDEAGGVHQLHAVTPRPGVEPDQVRALTIRSDVHPTMRALARKRKGR